MRNALRGIDAINCIEYPGGERRRAHIPSGGSWRLDSKATIPSDRPDLLFQAPAILAAIKARHDEIRAAFPSARIRQDGATMIATVNVADKRFFAYSSYGNRTGWGSYIIASDAFDDLLPDDAEGPYLAHADCD